MTPTQQGLLVLLITLRVVIVVVALPVVAGVDDVLGVGDSQGLLIGLTDPDRVGPGAHIHGAGQFRTGCMTAGFDGRGVVPRPAVDRQREAGIAPQPAGVDAERVVAVAEVGGQLGGRRYGRAVRDR